MWVIIGFPIAFVQVVVIISAFRNGAKAVKSETFALPEEK